MKSKQLNLNEKRISFTKVRNDHPPPNFNPPQEKLLEKSNLLLAVENECPEIVNALIQIPEIDVNAKTFYPETNEEKTALILSVEKGNVEIVKHLLSRSDLDVNLKIFDKRTKEEKTALNIAIEKGNC